MSVGCGGCWIGPATMRLAEAVPPFPASFEVTALVVLVCVPEVVPIRFTANVHEAVAARDAPERMTLVDPAAAVIVPPPQLPVKPFGVLTTCPTGRVSVKPIPLKDRLALGLDRLKVRVVLPFNATLPAPNSFRMTGGSFAGGGGKLLDEPPPQPTFQRRLAVITHKSDAESEDTRNRRVIGTSLSRSSSQACYRSWSGSGTSSAGGFLFICR